IKILHLRLDARGKTQSSKFAQELTQGACERLGLTRQPIGPERPIRNAISSGWIFIALQLFVCTCYPPIGAWPEGVLFRIMRHCPFRPARRVACARIGGGSAD